MNLKESIVNLHLETYGKEEGELVSDLASNFLELKDTISISIKRKDNCRRFIYESNLLGYVSMGRLK